MWVWSTTQNREPLSVLSVWREGRGGEEEGKVRKDESKESELREEEGRVEGNRRGEKRRWRRRKGINKETMSCFLCFSYVCAILEIQCHDQHKVLKVSIYQISKDLQSLQSLAVQSHVMASSGEWLQVAVSRHKKEMTSTPSVWSCTGLE